MRHWMRPQVQARRALDAMTPTRWALALLLLIVAWLVFVPTAEADAFQTPSVTERH